MVQYKIQNQKYFESLSKVNQKVILSIINEMYDNGLNTDKNIDRYNMDIPRLIKEGNILKKYVKMYEPKSNKSGSLYDFSRMLVAVMNVKKHDIIIRVKMTNVIHNAIHAYYSGAIRFYDIVSLLRLYKKHDQQILLGMLLHEGIENNRHKRAKSITEKIRLISSMAAHGKVQQYLKTDSPLITKPIINLNDYGLGGKFTDKPDFTKGEGHTPIMLKKGDVAEVKIIPIENNPVTNIPNRKKTIIEMVVPLDNKMGHIPTVSEEGQQTELQKWKKANGY